jgi:tetratricopeptide (TPR) repeat protein
MGRFSGLVMLAQVLLICGCAGSISPLQKHQAQRHYEYGLSHLYLEDTQAAYDEFEQAKELNPEEAKVYEALGLVLMQQNDYPVALTNLKRATELDPGLASAYQHISDVYIKLGEWAEAIHYARKALAVPAFSQRYQTHYNQGVALFNLQEYADAQREFTRVLELAPQWAEARIWLGKSLFAQGKTSLAIVEYREALTQAQLNWYEQDKQLLGYLYYQLGVAYINKGYVKQGVQELRQSLNVYPSAEAELALHKYEPQ